MAPATFRLQYDMPYERTVMQTVHDKRDLQLTAHRIQVGRDLSAIRNERVRQIAFQIFQRPSMYLADFFRVAVLHLELDVVYPDGLIAVTELMRRHFVRPARILQRDLRLHELERLHFLVKFQGEGWLQAQVIVCFTSRADA